MATKKFGEILKQARTELKITTRQAAEDTKIREDYLKEFEKSNYDVPLPEVYKRGFLRSYAQYLEVDPESVLDLLDTPKASTLNEVRSLNGENSEIPVSAYPDDRDSGIVEPVDSSTMSAPSSGTTKSDLPRKFSNSKCGQWLKSHLKERQWQVIFGGGILALILLTFWGFSSGSSNEELEALIDASPMETVAVEALPAKHFTILANDNVQVLVRDKDSKEKIFSGYLKRGASQEIEYHGNAQVSFSEGSAVSIRKDTGENLKPKKTGVGWMEVSY